VARTAQKVPQSFLHELFNYPQFRRLEIVTKQAVTQGKGAAKQPLPQFK
jgi:hypothetical protein